MGKGVDFEECALEIENKPLSVCLSDDSDDNDQRQLFELPARKIIRPPSSSFKKKLGTSKRHRCSKSGLCCKVCFATIIPIFLVTFIVATVISFAVLMVGVAGIKAELDGLKIRLSNAEDAEKDFNIKRDQLRKDFEEKLTQLTSHEEKVNSFKSTIEQLEKRLTSLNNSLTDLRSHPLLDVKSVKDDLNGLKNGMAETGSNILKLQGNHQAMDDVVKTLQSDVAKIKDDLFNATVKISQIEHEPSPVRATTPKTLVVTLTPDEETPVKKKDLDKALDTLRGEQKEICRQETSSFFEELDKLRNETLAWSSEFLKNTSSLSKNLFEEKVNSNSNAASYSTVSTTASKQDPSISPTTTSLATHSLSGNSSVKNSHVDTTRGPTSTKSVVGPTIKTVVPSTQTTPASSISGRTKGTDDLDFPDSAGGEGGSTDTASDKMNDSLQKLIDVLQRRKRT